MRRVDVDEGGGFGLAGLDLREFRARLWVKRGMRLEWVCGAGCGAGFGVYAYACKVLKLVAAD